MKIIPRDQEFYEIFRQLSTRVTAAAVLLQEIFAAPDKLEENVAEIKQLEHEADTLTQDVIERIDRTFVTPFDREDIHSLASELDDVIDLIDGTARRAAIFRISSARRDAVTLTEVLVRATRCMQDAVRDMKLPKRVSAANQELRLLEEEGDAIYHDAMGSLFAEEPDPVEIIKWKELYDKMEDALDQCEDVGNALQSISLKNA